MNVRGYIKINLKKQGVRMLNGYGLLAVSCKNDNEF